MELLTVVCLKGGVVSTDDGSLESGNMSPITYVRDSIHFAIYASCSTMQNKITLASLCPAGSVRPSV